MGLRGGVKCEGNMERLKSRLLSETALTGDTLERVMLEHWVQSTIKRRVRKEAEHGSAN